MTGPDQNDPKPGPQVAPSDDDRTQFSPAPAPTPPLSDDRTMFAPTSAPPGANAALADDADRTQFAAPPVYSAPPLDPVTLPPVSQPAPSSAPITRRPGNGPTVGVGTLINNNYEVKEVLKAGGMGEVYRGENINTGDPVAIKVILPELAGDEKVGLMFIREARTLSQLKDEAIVGYQNFVKDPAIERYFLIMDFIKGVPLSDYTAHNGPISLTAARTLLKRLAKGLDKAHAREVIHRDLSPDNVMLPDGSVAEALLIDFGIAKSNVVKEGTMAGQFAGKFKYVSPEQLGHFGGDIGPQTDVYSLALLMSAALLGKPLDMGGSIVEAVQRRQAIPDLAELPEELQPILGYMLEPNPKDRPESMSRVGYLVDHPEDIPAKYHGGRVPVPFTTAQMAGTIPPGLRMPPTSITVSGLQQPPTGATGMGRTQAPSTLPPLPIRKSGGGALGVLSFVFIAMLGGAGYVAWQNGMIPALDGLLGPATTATGQDPAPDQPQAPAAAPDIQSNTREGFLASFDTGPCTYAARIASGANAGMVQGFGERPGLFAGLPTAYEEKFGARPALLESQITPEQCAVLALARGLQGRGLEEVTIQLDQSTVASGAPISGQIVDPLGRTVWLVLVTPKGGVFNLTPRLSDLVADRRTFRFGLSLATGAADAPQLLLAIATADPLVNAAAARDGADASALLPLIALEIANRGGQGSAALAHIVLTQAPPAALVPDPATDPAADPAVTPEPAATDGN